MLRRRQKKPVAVPEIVLTPLIDTALNLLIVFMIATPLLQNSIKVDLPQGSLKEAGNSKQELVIYIDRSGKLFLNTIPFTSINNLIPTLKRYMHGNAERMVFVKADKEVAYGRVIELVDQLKTVGGIKYVALATKRPK